MAMVSAASSPESIDLPRSMVIDPSPAGFGSPEVVSDPAPSSPEDSRSGGTPDREDPSTSSPDPNRGGEAQSEVVLRSEEYRQLFRLPAEEVLVQDFNCAFQESILLQGHMYLFVRYICFYSNIFGFETKKVIPFNEVTCVKRAKTAGIFPNAIEIFAGGKKYFFASFLSRDEAFKLIHDGWLEHDNAVKAKSEVSVMEQQDSLSESNKQVNGIVVERIGSSKYMTNELDSTVRDENPSILGDSDVPVVSQNDASPSHDTVQQNAEPVVNIVPSSSISAVNWKVEDLDARKISADYTKVAETKFSISVEEFFRLFFSDDTVDFVESFHKKCGDKEFRCTSWQPHDKFGHIRDVSFQHPIKIYFGAKFGSCQETQKFRVYRDSHLVIETSQEINDVPYGDYFTVEGLWDVQRERKNLERGCILHVYVDVAFSKRTVWKGKIVQSTLEECREAYATWIAMAHELLKRKNLETQEGTGPGYNFTQNTGVPSEREEMKEEGSERTSDSCGRMINQWTGNREDMNVAGSNLLQGGLRNVTSIASSFRDPWLNFVSFLKSQSRMSQVLFIAFAVILLLQVTILVLLNRPQHIHVASPMDYYMGGAGSGRAGERLMESIAWFEKRIHFLRDEMLMVEARLERMQREHALLKAHLRDLEQLRKQR